MYLTTTTEAGGFISEPISDEKYQALHHAYKSRLAIFAIEEIFDMVVENYYELQQEIADIALRDMLFDAVDFQAFRMMLNRRVVNLMTACKSYLDHIPQRLNILVPNAAEKFKTKKAAIYDSSLHYRIVDALRNHVQHCGLPVHNVSINMAWEGPHSGPMAHKSRSRHHIDFHIDVEELSADSKFKASVILEMRKENKKWNLKECLAVYVEGLTNLHSYCRELIAPAMEANDQAIKKALEDFQARHPKASLDRIRVSEHRNSFKDAFLISLADDASCELQKKNRCYANLSKRYIATAGKVEA